MTAKNKPICVVLTGAGISAESGIPTFRSEDGLWAGHKVEEVCTPEALKKNRAKYWLFIMNDVVMLKLQSLMQHTWLWLNWKNFMKFNIITQNVDDLT